MSGATIGERVELFPLDVGPEEDGLFEVGRSDTGVFVALPAEGVAILEWLAAGLSVDETGQRFAERFGQAPDMAGFLESMRSCGFVRAIDGVDAEAAMSHEAASAPVTRSNGIALFTDLAQQRVAWLLSTPMRMVYAVVWLAVPVLLVIEPQLRPRAADGFIVPRALTNALLITVIASILAFLHEMAHALTVRALGCVGRLSLSRRLLFLVAQTEMTGVRALPRHRRYAPYLAGMTWDLGLMLGCFALQLAGHDGGLIRGVVYTLTVALVFQFMIFMRTDVYFVIANRFRMGDMMGDTRRYLRDFVRRVLGRPPSGERIELPPPREQRIIRWYAPIYVAGSVAVIVGFVLLTAPVTGSMLRAAAEGLGRGPASLAFWDSTGFVVLMAAQLGAFAWVVIRERRQRVATE